MAAVTVIRMSSICLPGRSPRTPACVRGWLRDTLEGWDARSGAIEALMLCASELVTNAVVHTDSARIRVGVREDDHRLVIEIIDQGPRQGPLEPAAGENLDLPCGRGLNLVASCSAEWGDEPAGRGSRVWAAVPSLEMPEVAHENSAEVAPSHRPVAA